MGSACQTLRNQWASAHSCLDFIGLSVRKGPKVSNRLGLSAEGISFGDGVGLLKVYGKLHQPSNNAVDPTVCSKDDTD